MQDIRALKKQEFFLDMVKNSKPLHKLAAAFFILFSIAISFLALENEIAIYLLALVAAVPVIFLIPLYPKIWLYTVILISPAFYFGSDEGVSVLDVIIAFYYIVFLGVWFIWQLGIKKEKLVKNYADWFVVFFFAVLPFNAVIAYLNGVQLADWIREYALFFVVLYYFPIKHYFSNREDLKRFLIVMITAIFIGYIVHFGVYYYYMNNAIQYAYQLGKGVRTTTAMAISGLLFALPIYFFIKDRKIKILLFIFSIVGIAAVVTTFARTTWVLLIFCLLILFIIVNFKQKINIILIGIFATSLIAGGAYFYLGENSGLYYKIIEKRFLSSSKGKSDISLITRFDEWDVAFSHIKDNPLGGNGLFKEFHFYNKITKTTKYTINIHNGYIYLVYRLGIPLALFYLLFIFINFYRSFLLTINIRQRDDPLLKAASLGAFLAILALIMMNQTAAIFTYRDGLFVTIYAMALIGIVETIRKKERQEEKYG